MPFFDLSLSELNSYRPNVAEPEDFDEFWDRTLKENPFSPDSLQVHPVTTGLDSVTAYDVRFPGYAGQPIAAWLLIPQVSSLRVGGRLPAVVQYVGYGGGRGLPEDHLEWVGAGYASLIIDTRGQGGSWGSGGHTPDFGHPLESSGSYPGVMTRGIESPETYYYRRLFVDAVNAVEACQNLEGVDPQRTFVAGNSQAGALSLVAAALHPNVLGALVSVPFLCNFERAVGLTGAYPYQEIVDYLSVRREQVRETFRTLSYFDAVLFSRRAKCPALFSVGLMDEVAPPSTVFAAKNWYGAESDIEVYPYNGHEGGGTLHWRREVEWLRDLNGGI